MSANPTHLETLPFPVADGELRLGGVAVRELARRAGRTPFYAYDRQVMSSTVKSLRTALPNKVELHYAIKANPMPAVVQHMAGLVDGLDVASSREMKVALDSGVDPASISMAGPGKTDAELEAANAAGIIVNLESESEMRRLANICERSGKRTQVAVRVNPDFELKASGMKMTGGPKPFGIDEERVPAMLTEMAGLALEFVGFHIFCGSQNLKPESLVEAQTNSVELACRLSNHVPAPVKVLNIGGGFGIPYFPGDKALALEAIADNLERLLVRVDSYMPQAATVLELGRYLVGGAGVYVCEVVDVKVSRGVTFVITNGGLHHHLAASGNFGQVIRKNYPLCMPEKMNADHTAPVNVVGPLCTPLDILGSKVNLPRPEVGDLIAVLQSGAYGFSASPHRFLSHPEPAELLV